MSKKLYYIIALSCLFFHSCNKDEVLKPFAPESKTYLHLSHTRTDSNPFMDSIVESIGYDKFDMLWLGGDLAQLTSADDSTMAHIDSIFNFGNTNTLWALGNHDYSDLERVEQYTNRAPYYSIYQNGITLIILDTQDSLSNIIGPQKDFLMGVLDTIQNSTHLILLHHKLIWMYNNIYLESQISSISNGGLGSCSYCINPNNFYSEIYPKLVEIKQNGIEVLCIGGDIGLKINEFEHITPEGIHFLASGIKSCETNNKALLFHHDLTNNSLTWNFELLTEL